MDPKSVNLKPYKINYVSSTDSPEFTLLSSSLTRSSIVALDAEWKPSRTRQSSFPTVSLLQIACRVNSEESDSFLFLVDLVTIPLSSIWEILRDVFVSPDILKLGFRFKQDLIYLSSTFSEQGCEPGFDRLEPFLDISSIYGHLQRKQHRRKFYNGAKSLASTYEEERDIGKSKVGTFSDNPSIHPVQHNRPGRKVSKETKGLATICEEVLGFSLSKELQCSDWSHRPLTEEQKLYAAADAQCLLEIFSVFQQKIGDEGNFLDIISELLPRNLILGLKDFLENPNACVNVLRPQICQASDMVRSVSVSKTVRIIHAAPGPGVSCRNVFPLSALLTKIVRKYGDSILLKKSDRKPKTPKRKKKGKGKWLPQKIVYGLKDILEEFDVRKDRNIVVNLQLCQASDIVRSANISRICQKIYVPEPISRVSCGNTVPFDAILSKVVKHYGERILLKDTDRMPKIPKRRSKKPSLLTDLRRKGKWVEPRSEPQDPLPIEFSLEGDGCSKFLCDVMVTGLAKHLRCVGIDAAVPFLQKPEPRQLINQAQKEKRVILTRDTKLLRHGHLVNIYKIKSLLKNDQLLEVIEAFELKISEGNLMSRCTKCNGTFIQKPLTTEEAIQAGKGFQVIPNCLFNRNLEFWQCMDCNQLYWEGTQYHNAVQKFVNVCKLND
ncbi:hypothetical protein GIB67_033391 [Kingdonia uniflora]|uniref:3'-5' exonuclease domain-containing protein n=1 Tax=Kingdonia uniflora TaxID=39325 RepID=A0A7J7LU15_9MAGN|nr:hypothetical protein GIB67_033391 [Kingdonia uniflora]